MKTIILAFLFAGCVTSDVDPMPDAAPDAAYPYFDIPCSDEHCTTVVCPEAGPCTCYWPPANTIRCNGPADGAP